MRMKVDISGDKDNPALATGHHNDLSYVCGSGGYPEHPGIEVLHIGDELEIWMTEHQMDLVRSFFENT